MFLEEHKFQSTWEWLVPTKFQKLFRNSDMIRQIIKKIQILNRLLEPLGYNAKDNVLLLKVDLLERLLKHLTVCLKSGKGENLDCLYRCLYKYCHFLLSHSLPNISDQRGKKSCEVTDKTRCVHIFKNELCINIYI